MCECGKQKKTQKTKKKPDQTEEKLLKGNQMSKLQARLSILLKIIWRLQKRNKDTRSKSQEESDQGKLLGRIWERTPALLYHGEWIQSIKNKYRGLVEKLIQFEPNDCFRRTWKKLHLRNFQQAKIQFISCTCDVGAVWHLTLCKISPSQNSCFGHKATGK